MPSNMREQTEQLLAAARAATSGRGAHLLYGGPETTLSQTVIALRSGASLPSTRIPAKQPCSSCTEPCACTPATRFGRGAKGTFLSYPRGDTDWTRSPTQPCC